MSWKYRVESWETREEAATRERKDRVRDWLCVAGAGLLATGACIVTGLTSSEWVFGWVATGASACAASAGAVGACIRYDQGGYEIMNAAQLDQSEFDIDMHAGIQDTYQQYRDYA